MRRVPILLALAALVVAVAAVPALAQDDSLSAVHGIPETPVDVYVDGEAVVEGFNFGEVAGPVPLEAGDYEVAITPAGEPVESAVLSGTVAVAGAASGVAHLDEDGNPTLTAFANDTSAIAAGECRVVAHHTGKAPTVDVYADGNALFTGLSNGESQGADVPAGTYAVAVAPAGTSAGDAVLEADVTCAEGTAVLVYAVGDLEEGTLTVASQTITGLQSAPESVPSGEGALPASGVPFLAVLLALIGVAAIGIGVPALRRNR